MGTTPFIAIALTIIGWLGVVISAWEFAVAFGGASDPLALNVAASVIVASVLMLAFAAVIEKLCQIESHLRSAAEKK